MKIMQEHIDFPGQSTIKIKFGEVPFLSYPWHYHQENEIVYLIESTGTRYIADSIEPFGPGDLVLLAGNLPHYWRNDEKYYLNNSELKVKRLVIQFPNDFLQPQLEQYTEFHTINKLIKRSERGVRFLQPESEEIGKWLLKLPHLEGFKQLNRFIDILYNMSLISNYKLLASEAYRHSNPFISDNRLEKVTRYLLFNYQNQISLEDIAEIAGLQPNSFCRYFKNKTGKSFSVYLNELRIGFACKLLIKGEMQVSQICHETGFNNLSNFNRTFKNITGYSPTNYRENYLLGKISIDTAS